MKFTSLNTPEFIVRALETKNIAECTEIQKEVIPLLSEDKDVIGQSKTGSGKTFAYAIPAAEKWIPKAATRRFWWFVPRASLPLRW